MKGSGWLCSVQATAAAIPSTLLTHAGATASVSKQTTTWKPGGSAGHLVMQASSWSPKGPWVRESPSGCAARNCQVDSQAAFVGEAGATGHLHPNGKLVWKSLFCWVPLPGAALPSALEIRAGISVGETGCSEGPACLQHPHILPVSWALTLALPFLLPFSSPRLGVLISCL